MEREQRESETHILVIPFPAQGHINPMLQFSKRLASKGLKVTLVNTNSTCKFLQTQATSSINIESIFVGFEEGIKPEGIEEYLKHFKTIVSQSLVELIEKQNGSKYPIKFLVYDSNMPWALDLARQLCIGAAPFFTQSYMVNSIYYNLHQGTLKIPLDGSMVSLPSMPLLEINDLPSLVYDTGLYPTIVKLTMSQFHNLQKANCIFLNTFDKLEEEGHLNPLFQFSKCLASKGLKVTLVTTTSISKSMQGKASSINIETISDVSIEGIKLEDLEDYLQCFRVVVSQSLFELIERQNKSKNPLKFLIYDSVMPWALDVARRLGLEAAPFFTQPCAVNAIYYHLHQGALKLPLEGSMVSLPSIPLLENNDLPFLDNLATLKLLVNQFSNFQEPNCLLFNTFDTLEDEVVSWMASQWPIKTIGPTIPSIYLDKRLEDDKDYGLNLFKPNIDGCMKWLDSKETDSVVYVSFGSLAALGEEQMEELAWGLKRSNHCFLWVVRETEEKKLPSNFMEETSETGLVVNWSPQLEVLAHKAVGCFMTHCGWNSTIEALSLGVPMVAMPQWTDQTTNAKFVADVWQTGVRVKTNEKGIVTREEIELCVKEVMEGERGNKIRRNSEKWKILAKEAVDEGGSSDKNIDEFVAKLIGN